MRYLFLTLIFLASFTGLFAQDSLTTTTPDSLLTTAELDSIRIADSLAALALMEPEEPSYDTIQVEAFDVNTIKTGLSFSIDKQETAYVKLKVGHDEQYVLFEGGKAEVEYEFSYDGELVHLQTAYEKGKTKHKYTKLVHIKKRKDGSLREQSIPLWWSIVPPLVAILLALLFRQVLISLFTGIFMGSWLISGMPFTPYDFLHSFFRVLDTYIVGALTNSGHLSVVLFSLMIGGVVALISRNGGMAGIVKKLSPLARGPKSTQFVAWLLGLAIFFDDYANTLIVGNTIRPIMDKYRISREKLAYIVDSTAAPVAAIAFITTWIGAELGYISDALPTLEGLDSVPSAYSVFLNSLAYSFYSIFTLIFIVFIVGTGRDYGTMYKAERRARTTGKVYAKKSEDMDEEDLEELEPVEGAPLRWINGLVPVMVVVIGTLLGLLDTGMNSSHGAIADAGISIEHNGWGEVWSNLKYINMSEKELHNILDEQDHGAVWSAASQVLGDEASSFVDQEAQKAKIDEMNPYLIWEKDANLVEASSPAPGGLRKLGIIIGNSDSYNALLWASLAAIFIALMMTVAQRIMKLEEAINTMVMGFKTMLPALLILVFAWSLAHTTEELETAEFLTMALGDSLTPYTIPIIIFLLAAFISFSTGSSWSTMAILYPIAIPLTWTVCLNSGLDADAALPILYNVIAVVLSASVLGDHCSPISDTTILSSLASGCDHIDHVRTQLPYALTVGVVSIVCTYLAALGVPFFVNFFGGLIVLFLVVRLFGKKVDDEVVEEA